jgi:hypothetical protein
LSSGNKLNNLKLGYFQTASPTVEVGGEAVVENVSSDARKVVSVMFLCIVVCLW